MAITLKLYNLKKRKNSTLRPTQSTLSQTYSATLKDSTSILNPVFIIDTPDNEDKQLPSGRYIEAIYDGGDHYYYWLSDIRSIAYGIWEMSAELDVLATWRTDIGDTTAYIYRCSDSQNAGELIDEYLQLSSYKSLLRNDYTMSLSFGLLGYYVVALNGSTSANISRYGNELIGFATANNLSSFLTELYNLGDNDSVLNTIAAIMGQGTGLQNVVSGIYFIPIANDGALQLNYNLSIFGYTFSQTCRGILSTGLGDTVSLTFNTSNYSILQTEPYSEYSIYLPYAGEVQIPSSVALNAPYVKYNLDCKTGDITYTIGYSGGKYKTLSTSCAVQCKFDIVTDNIAADNVRYWQNGISAAISRNVNGVFEAIGNMQDNNTHSYSGGNQRLFDILDGEHKIVAYTKRTNALNSPPEYRQLIGLPYCETGLIKNHRGYIKCINASVNGTGIDVRDSINAYLNGGFYYE